MTAEVDPMHSVVVGGMDWSLNCVFYEVDGWWCRRLRLIGVTCIINVMSIVRVVFWQRYAGHCRMSAQFSAKQLNNESVAWRVSVHGMVCVSGCMHECTVNRSTQNDSEVRGSGGDRGCGSGEAILVRCGS